MRKQSLLLTVAVCALTVIALLSTLGARGAQAQDEPPTAATPAGPTRTVTVSGQGEIRAAPDIVTISLGVRSEGDTSADALDANSTSMETLIATLKGAGVAERDIQTTNFSIWPQYADTTRSSTTPRITGYEVSNQVTITVRDLANFGSVLDAAVRAGGNQVSDIRFGFSNPQALLDQAREGAMADAERKATQLAGLADVTLGTVVTINEHGGSMPIPMPLAMDVAQESRAVPIESGESAVNVTLSVTYELAIP